MEPVWTDLTKWRTSAGTKTPTLSTVVSLPPVSYLQDPWWDPWHETVNETLYDQHGTAAPAGRCRAHGLFQTTNQMIILSSLGPPSNRQDPSAQFLLGFPQQALPCDIRWIHFLQALQILHRSLGRSFQHVKHHEHHELCWIIVRTSINKSWILTHPYHDSPYVTIPYVIMVNMKRSIIISYGSYQYSYQYSYQLKFPFIHGRVLPVLIIFCNFLGFSHEITPPWLRNLQELSEQSPASQGLMFLQRQQRLRAAEERLGLFRLLPEAGDRFGTSHGGEEWVKIG